jgi:hypothetical protein
MAGIIIIDGAGGVNKAGVDTDGNLRINPRPPAFGSLGYYRQAALSGTIAVTLAANSPLWSCRWTNGTDLCLVQSVKINLVSIASITVVPFEIGLFFARSYTATDTGGTAVGVPASMQKLRTSMGSSLMGDWRIATTGTLTAGTRTLDTNPLAIVSGLPTTAGTTLSGNGAPVPLYVRDNNDNHPIILAQNEGLVITNPLIGPSTGTFTIMVQMEWGEVAAF